MFGVILWKDQNTGCGLVWCEDHKDLAVFDTGAFRQASDMPPAANDHILFEVESDMAGMRRVSRVIAHWADPSGGGSGLGDALLNVARASKGQIAAG